jgi:hypothetical protein
MKNEASYVNHQLKAEMAIGVFMYDPNKTNMKINGPSLEYS